MRDKLLGFFLGVLFVAIATLFFFFAFAARTSSVADLFIPFGFIFAICAVMAFVSMKGDDK